MRALTHDLADIIYLMLRQACPQALGRGDTHQQLRALHTVFHTINNATADEIIALTIHNQDLSGFFTSISTERFLNSLHLMTHWYRGKSKHHATTFTSTHHEPDPTMRVHRGRPQHRKPRRHTIHLQHLPDICKATLLLNYCLVGNQLLQQTRGPSLTTSNTPHPPNLHSADTSPLGT